MNLMQALRLGAPALLAIWLGGCASGTEQERTTGSAPDAPLAQADVDAGAATFSAVRANGTGCPPGTVSTSISRDGLVFTTTFSSYITQVNPAADVSVRDCQLEIELHTPEGRSYSVQKFSYSGFALLQDGVIGRQTASYYFQGNPVAPVESNRTELTGPYDRTYLFTDEVRLEDRVWSPCGAERNLNLITRVQLFNGSPRRSGYMNLTSIDGSARLELVLASRPCQVTEEPPRAALAKVTRASVTPASIERDQPFAVRWTAPPENVEASYTVQLRTHERDGDALVWESAATRNGQVVYDGPPLEAAGAYQLLVIARRGSEEARSDRIALEVREVIGAEPALGKPTALRVLPSPIVRDQPFVVTWSAPEKATPSTVYRVHVHTAPSEGFARIASAPETPATIAALPADVLPRNGSYQVVVMARDGEAEVASEPLTVEAVAQQVDRTGPVEPPPVTSPEARLVGRYATRTMAYSQTSSGARGALKELALAEIVEGPRGLELRSTLCYQQSSGLGFAFLLTTPEAYPTFVRDVRIEGGRWFTESGPIGTGYEREGVAACRGRAGQYVPKLTGQRWVSGASCRCPVSASSVPKVDDCRIHDPDGDGHPALAYKWYGPGGTFDYTSHVATVQRSQLRAGTLAADGRHAAQLRYDETSYPITCEGALCRVGESTLSFTPCVSRYNPVEFVPLPDPPSDQPRWTCSALRSAEARLFRRTTHGAPSRCEVEGLTDPQP